MPIGASTALLIGGGISAGSSIMGGEMQAGSIKKKAEYDASIFEQQAEMVKQKKKIFDYQSGRAQGQMMSSMVAKTAGKGLTLSGSPLAVMIDNDTQLKFDQAIEDYNLDIERNYARSAAASTREQGALDARSTRMAGYTNAFSTLLNVGASVSTPGSSGAVLGNSKKYYPGYRLPSARVAGYARGY